MPRTKRRASATKIYNVAIKGANSQVMFLDDDDREKFLEALDGACEKYDVGVAARVLMSNHVHLVLHGELDMMARVFKSLGASYVGYFNRKYGHTGPLWNARYYSDPIESTVAYMQVTGYIFNNPVAAGIAKSPTDYIWSNLRALLDGDDPQGRKLLEEVSSADEIHQYALDYSEAKSEEMSACVCEIVPRTRIGDVDVIEFVKDFVGTANFTEALNKDAELLKNLLENLLDLGSNVNQMSRVTGICYGRIRNLLG